MPSIPAKVVVFLLKVVKKLRGFDASFTVRDPDTTSKKSYLLWKLQVLYPLLWIDVNLRKHKESHTIIDICIPVSEKDIKQLPSVIEAAFAFIKHPVNKLYIIAAPGESILALCKIYNAVFVDETTVLGYKKEQIKYEFKGKDRSGWLFQQLLKLNADTVTEMNNFLILDADTRFCMPRVFIHGNKTIFDISTERHEAYHTVYEKILKRKTTCELSFVTHYMLFNKQMLQKLKAEIAAIHSKKWDEVIIENVDRDNISGFSEYEMYGNYVLGSYPSLMKKEYWFNQEGKFEHTANYIKSVSLHNYN